MQRQYKKTPPPISVHGANPKAGRRADVGDAKIYYEVYGKEKPIFFLQGGIAGSNYEVAQFIDSLKKSDQVTAVSNRGNGKSEMGAQVPSDERKAANVIAIINAVTKDSLTVLGFSDGAYTGYFLAAAHPEKVKKLIAGGAGEWKQGSRTYNNTRKLFVGMDSAPRSVSCCTFAKQENV